MTDLWAGLLLAGAVWVLEQARLIWVELRAAADDIDLIETSYFAHSLRAVTP